MGKGELLTDVHGPGTAYVAHAPWDASMTAYLKENKVRRLILNGSFGWRLGGDGLNFLRDMPELEMLNILDYGANDITPIEDVVGLRELHLLTGPASELDFSKLTHLENCAIQSWRMGLQSVFTCTTLTRLYLYSVPIHTLDPLSALENLRDLEIKTSPISSLDGIERLVSLSVVRLGRLTKLDDVSELSSLRSLVRLEFDTCKRIKRLDDLRSLATLDRLSFDNCDTIESLRPIEDLSRLEQLAFVESTNIVDGDLTVILDLPKLKRVLFKDRKHYSHTREEINNILNSRRLASLN